MGKYYLTGTEFQFWKMKTFQRWMVVMLYSKGLYLMPLKGTPRNG